MAKRKKKRITLPYGYLPKATPEQLAYFKIPTMYQIADNDKVLHYYDTYTKAVGRYNCLTRTKKEHKIKIERVTNIVAVIKKLQASFQPKAAPIEVDISAGKNIDELIKQVPIVIGAAKSGGDDGKKFTGEGAS